MFKPCKFLPRLRFLTKSYDVNLKYTRFQTESEVEAFDQNLFDLNEIAEQSGDFHKIVSFRYILCSRDGTVLDKRFASAKNTSKAAAKQAQLNHYFTT